ncbi:MAG: PA4642 family protein [Gammaproteobacteria bacterium]
MINNKTEKTESRYAILHPSRDDSAMVKRPDKKVVMGETFSDEALESFLCVAPTSREPADFCRLRVAYQFMPVVAFERFLDLLLTRGKAINPCDEKGRSFLSYLESNVNQTEYAMALKSRLLDA